MFLMKLKIALCALLLAFMTTTASAKYTADDGWTGWGGWDDTNWGWDQDKEWDGGCAERCDDDCGPTGVPSPTAALMGLGAMGLMLSRRGRRQH